MATFQELVNRDIIFMRIPKDLRLQNISYEYSENSGSVTWHNQPKLAKSVDGLKDENGASK